MIDKSIINIAFNTKNYGLRNKTKNISTIKNKLCGDKITVELVINKRIIKKMYYETQSCIFCQASASLLSQIVHKINVKDWPVIVK